MHDGYWALLLCLLTNLTPEQALSYIEKGTASRVRRTLSENDVKEMCKLKETMSYRKIAELFNMSEAAVFKRIKRYQTTRQMLIN